MSLRDQQHIRRIRGGIVRLISPCECHDGEHELDMQCRCDVCYSNAMDILYDRGWYRHRATGLGKWRRNGTNTKTDEGVRHRKGMLEWEYFRELKERGTW